MSLFHQFAEKGYRGSIARRAQGDLEGALQDYNEALRLNPDYATALPRSQS